MYQLTKDVFDYLKNSEQETLDLIETLSKIPAPSGKETERANFVKDLLLLLFISSFTKLEFN